MMPHRTPGPPTYSLPALPRRLATAPPPPTSHDDHPGQSAVTPDAPAHPDNHHNVFQAGHQGQGDEQERGREEADQLGHENADEDADGDQDEDGYEYDGEYDDDEEEEEEEEDEEDEDEDEDQETFPSAHHCPIHHFHPTPPDQPVYFQDVDAYSLSDSLDMSDDAGAPLEDPLADFLTAHTFSDDVDMDGSGSADSDTGPELDLPWIADADADDIDNAFFVLGPPDAAALAIQLAAAVPAPGTIPPPAPEVADLGFNAFAPPLPVIDATAAADAAGEAAAAAWQEGFFASNPNPATIGPSNFGLTDFLHHWARQSRLLQGVARGQYPWPSRINELESSQLTSVRRCDLEGDQCDFQGINWDHMGVTRRAAKERRLLTYSNYVNIEGSDRWTPTLPDAALPRRDSFFQFRRMNFRKNIHLSHFQLRHLFASTSRSRVFYPAVGSVQQFNPMTGHGRAIMRIGDSPISQISTLAAGHGVLVAGSFHGDYTLRNLNQNEPSSTASHEGVITSSSSGITNHVAVQQSRTSSSPLAAFASNDDCFRVLDIATETWLSQEKLDFAPNCTAVSPDGRLRVVVGDSRDVIITAAEPQNGAGKPDVLQKLSGHRDYGFACDWADDGWTIATGFQDKTVKVWDARRFTDGSGNAQAVCTLRSEMAGVRTLRFSPIGSGKRVLVAAEEVDFVNIIDAQTYRSKQTLDIFGELGGVSFANAGQDLMVMCCDRTRGGILQLERCGEGKEFMQSRDEEGYGHEDRQRRSGNTYDWPRSVFTEEKRIKRGSYSRRKGLAAQLELEPF